MGGMDVAAAALPWIMEGWLASFHRSCRASNVPASKTYCWLGLKIRPFLFTFGAAEPNQPVPRFREDDEGAERSDPFMTTGRRVDVGLGRQAMVHGDEQAPEVTDRARQISGSQCQ